MPTITLITTIAGTVETFDNQAYVNNLANTLAGIQPSDIIVTVSAARRMLSGESEVASVEALAQPKSDQQRRELQTASGSLSVSAVIAPANPMAAFAARDTLQAMNPASLSAALGVPVLSMAPVTLEIVAIIAPSPPPPSIPPSRPPPPPPPPLSPPSPPPPPQSEGSWLGSAAIGAGAAVTISLGMGYAARKRKKRGTFGANSSDKLQDFKHPHSLDIPDENDDNAKLPSWLKQKSPLDASLGDEMSPYFRKGNFPMPPEVSPTGGISSRSDMYSNRSAARWGDMASSFKFSEDKTSGGDDDERRKKSAATVWTNMADELKYDGEGTKNTKSMWSDVSRDLALPEDSAALNKLTPDVIEKLAEDQAMRIEQRRLEQAKRIEARRKQLAARQAARVAARDEQASMTPAQREDAAKRQQQLAEAMKHKFAAQMLTNAAQKGTAVRPNREVVEDGGKERPGRVLRDGSTAPVATVKLGGPATLSRDNSALYSSADKERPSRKPVLRDGGSQPDSVVTLGGSKSAMTQDVDHLSKTQRDIEIQRAALEERRRQLAERQAGRASKTIAGAAMASAVERATGPEFERAELRSERTAATKERPESGRRGLSSSALSPPAKPLGEIARPTPPATLQRDNSALMSKADKERPERPVGSSSARSSSSSIEERRAALERRKAARAEKQDSSLSTTSSSASSSRSSVADSIAAQRQNLEERRRQLEERKSVREAKISSKASASPASNATNSDREELRAERSEASKERPSSRRTPSAPTLSMPGTSSQPVALARENSALSSSADKERPESRRRPGASSAPESSPGEELSSARSSALDSIQSQKMALEERRRMLEERKAKRMAASASATSEPTTPPPGTLSRDNSALHSSADKERPASRRESAVAAPAPPAALARQNSALSSSADKERPGSQRRSEALDAPETPADSERSGASTQREQLEERRRQLEARKAERLALQASATEYKPAQPLMQPSNLSRDNSALHSSADKERPASRRESAVAAPAPPAALARQNSALSSSADKERPESRHRSEAPAEAPAAPETPADSERSSSTTLSMREQLEERRRQLEERKAKRMAVAAAAEAVPAIPPALLTRDNSALSSLADKERPMSEQRKQLEERRQQLEARKAAAPIALRRHNSALSSDASKERPSKRRDIDDDDDFDA